jgi:hypothetical protein
MKRCLVTLVVFVLCLAPLRADLTFTQTMTMEGGAMAAMMAGKPVVITTRLKGMKARSDMEVMDTKITSLTDLKSKEITILNHKEQTAQVISAVTPPADMKLPKMAVDISFKPTGESKAIDGVQCFEHVFKMSFAFGDMMPQSAPKESQKEGAETASKAAEMMKDMKMMMDGSVWIAKSGPGASEYMAFQKAALEGNLTDLLAGMMGGQQIRGGMDKLMKAITEAPGLPYLTEISMAVDGTGPMVEMMKQQMAGMKLVQKMSSISTDPLADDVFTVPTGYTVKK